jgi:predicted dienelactone hydrolase
MLRQFSKRATEYQPRVTGSRNHTRIGVWLTGAWLALSGLQAGAVEASNAGLRQWTYEHYDTRVEVAIWYPTSDRAVAINAGPFTPYAASNAALPASGKHPLLLLSHGTGGSNIAHHPIAEALASAGYIVAAPTHPGDNYQDRSLLASEQYFDERPRQLTSLLNALTEDATFAALIDTSRIGAIGHSVGGYTVAAMVGASPDRAALIEHCTSVDDDPSCGYGDPTIGTTGVSDSPFQLPANPQVKASELSISSVVLLAPLGSVIDKESRIDDKVAIRVIAAEFDEILPHQYHRQRLQHIAPHAEVSSAPGAGHFSFIAPVNAAWQQSLSEVAIDPAGFDRSAFNTQLGQTLIEWFNTTLATK